MPQLWVPNSNYNVLLQYSKHPNICQGDITKQALKNLSGKDDYQFGDVTKKFLGNVLKKGDKK